MLIPPGQAEAITIVADSGGRPGQVTGQGRPGMVPAIRLARVLTTRV